MQTLIELICSMLAQGVLGNAKLIGDVFLACHVLRRVLRTAWKLVS